MKKKVISVTNYDESKTRNVFITSSQKSACKLGVTGANPGKIPKGVVSVPLSIGYLAQVLLTSPRAGSIEKPKQTQLTFDRQSKPLY